VKDAAQDVTEGAAENVPQDVAQDLAFGARAANFPLKSLFHHTTTLRVLNGASGVGKGRAHL